MLGLEQRLGTVTGQPADAAGSLTVELVGPVGLRVDPRAPVRPGQTRLGLDRRRMAVAGDPVQRPRETPRVDAAQRGPIGDRRALAELDRVPLGLLPGLVVANTALLRSATRHEDDVGLAVVV